MIDQLVVLQKQEGELTAVLLKSDGDQYTEALRNKELILVRKDKGSQKRSIRQVVSFLKDFHPSIFLLCSYEEIPEDIRTIIEIENLDCVSVFSLVKYSSANLSLDSEKLINFFDRSEVFCYQCLTLKKEEDTYKLFDEIKKLSEMHQASPISDFDIMNEIAGNDLEKYESKLLRLKSKIKRVNDEADKIKSMHATVISRIRRLETALSVPLVKEGL